MKEVNLNVNGKIIPIIKYEKILGKEYIVIGDIHTELMLVTKETIIENKFRQYSPILTSNNLGDVLLNLDQTKKDKINNGYTKFSQWNLNKNPNMDNQMDSGNYIWNSKKGFISGLPSDIVASNDYIGSIEIKGLWGREHSKQNISVIVLTKNTKTIVEQREYVRQYVPDMGITDWLRIK